MTPTQFETWLKVKVSLNYLAFQPELKEYSMEI